VPKRCNEPDLHVPRPSSPSSPHALTLTFRPYFVIKSSHMTLTRFCHRCCCEPDPAWQTTISAPIPKP
jgi:hypothetical protein